jgi:hypothetical protein
MDFDLQPMRVSEEPGFAFISLGQNPVFTSLSLRSPFHVVPPLDSLSEFDFDLKFKVGLL